MSRRRKGVTVLGLIFLLAYGLPLFLPPAATYPAPAPPTAEIFERLFPGVPACWVLSRLVFLLVGGFLIVSATGVDLPLRLRRADADRRVHSSDQPIGVLAWIALVVALVHACTGFYAARFDRLAETSYFFFLAVPAVLLACSEVRPLLSGLVSLVRRSLGFWVLPALWVAWSAATAWRSAKAADVIDMWLMLQRLQEVAAGKHQILVDSATPGHTNAYMMLEGAPFFGPGQLPVTFVGLQITHLFWAVVCAVAIASVVQRLSGRPAAIVAQAVFLFSPFVLSTAYNPGLMIIGPLCVVILLLLLLVFQATGSAASLAAFGAVAGFSATEPTVVLTTVFLCIVLALSLGRALATKPRRLSVLALAVAALSGIAAVLPGLPHPMTLSAMLHKYTRGSGQLAGMVLILYGQETPYTVMDMLQAGHPGVVDAPLGALLAPFAIARSPLRLWGDALLEPIGTVLMVIGLLLCLRRVRRNPAAALILGLLATALAHAFVSAGDAVSYTRLAGAVVPFAVLSASGFEALRPVLASRWRPMRAAACVVVAVVSSGLLLFELVNPSILPSSWLGISMQALGTRRPNADAVFLEHGGPGDLSWLHVRRIASLLPAHPQATLTLEEFEHPASAAAESSKVFFWSPALEQDAAVSRQICARWPQAALYRLMDQPCLLQAYAAAPQGRQSWRPQLPPDRWSVSSCKLGLSSPAA